MGIVHFGKQMVTLGVIYPKYLKGNVEQGLPLVPSVTVANSDLASGDWIGQDTIPDNVDRNPSGMISEETVRRMIQAEAIDHVIHKNVAANHWLTYRKFLLLSC